MGYAEMLSVVALFGAAAAGFMLAQTPGQRGGQIAAMLPLAAAWWALCESHWNAASDPAEALLWADGRLYRVDAAGRRVEVSLE